jgi:hypothetical protein
MGDSVFTYARRIVSEWYKAKLREPYRLFGLRIDGVEVTQAIQYYHADQHLTDAADVRPGNAARLVAAKPAWVRVYVRSGLLAQIADVTGSVELQRRTHKLLWQTVDVLSPRFPGSVTALRDFASYEEERGRTGASLNFVIPAEKMYGLLRLIVRVDAPGRPTETQTVNIDATLLQTLRLAYIMVSYNGPDGAEVNPTNVTLPAPTVADLESTTARTLTLFPVQSTAAFESAGSLEWNLPLDDARIKDGDCSANWHALMVELAELRVADGARPDVIYFALLPAGVPVEVDGCALHGVTAGRVGQRWTMAHEVGHGCGLPHAPCGDVGEGFDADYAAYEPYDPNRDPEASIGEYGLDIGNGIIHRPQTNRDLMSYCDPPWMSLHNHAKLINNSMLKPAVIGLPKPWREDLLIDPHYRIKGWPWPPPIDPLGEEILWREETFRIEPLVSITGVVDETGRVEVLGVARVRAVRNVRGARPTEFVAELVGEDGERLAGARVFRMDARGHGCGCGGGGKDDEYSRYIFQALLPDAGAGAALRIVREKDEVWSRTATAHPPRINGFEVSPGERGEAYARWDVEIASAEEQARFWLRWSDDGGKSWRAFRTGLRGREARVSLAALPPGEALIQLLAHDGFHTSVSEPAAVRVPRRAPEVVVMHPQQGQTYLAGSTLRLWGAARGGDGRRVADAKAGRWTMDGREVARGLDAWVTAPPPGEHRCTLSLIEGGREVATRHVTFNTIEVPPDDERTSY